MVASICSQHLLYTVKETDGLSHMFEEDAPGRTRPIKSNLPLGQRLGAHPLIIVSRAADALELSGDDSRHDLIVPPALCMLYPCLQALGLMVLSS
jgi:hypothetical protein